MKKVGIKLNATYVIYFLFAHFLISSLAFAQTGNSWKIMVSEPKKDPNWYSVGLTKSATPRFPRSVLEPNTQGSCVVIRHDLVLTVAHAVRSTKLTIVLDGTNYEANLIAIDTYDDRAILKLVNSYGGTVKNVRQSGILDGEVFKSYGYGKGYGYHDIKYKDGLFYGDAYYGDSGGPILDSNGEIAGVICATSKDDVINKTNIFSYGHKTLYKWVEDNKDNSVENPRVTLCK